MPLDRSRRQPRRASCWPPCAGEIAFGTPSPGAKPWPTRPSPSLKSSGDDATIVRVLNHVFGPLKVPSQLEQVVARTARPWFGPSALVTRYYWPVRLGGRAIDAANAGDIDEMDRYMNMWGSLAGNSTSPP